MGSILDSLGSLWNAGEHAGGVVFHSIEDAISHLGGLGVPAFSSLGQFVQFLVLEGENPFIFLPQVMSTINSRGGNPVQVLEELAWGFITEGPVPFTQKQLSKRVNPVLQGLNEHTQAAHTVALVHQDTIIQTQQKLTMLKRGSNGSMGMQGDFVLAMDTKFATTHANVTQLAAPLSASTSDPWSEFGGSVSRANYEFALALEHASMWGIVGFALLDLAVIVVFCVVDVAAGIATLGLADVALGPLEWTALSAMVLAELQILGLWLPLMHWLLAILAAVDVLVREEAVAQAQNTTATPTPTPGPTPTPTPRPTWWPWPDPLPPDLVGRSPTDRDDCLRKISQVKAQFPGVRADLIHYLVCLEPAMTPEEVIAIFTNWKTQGMTEQDINDFLSPLIEGKLRLPPGYKQPLRVQIIKFLRTYSSAIPDIWQKYKQIKDIPNADFILYQMIIGPDSKYRGTYFQLSWIAAHSSQVAQVEAFGADDRQGADAVLNDHNGTLIDTKADIWSKQKFLLDRGIAATVIRDQLNRYMTDANFRGRPVIYVFSSEGGKIPASIMQEFVNARARGLNITIKYWPNPDPPQIVP